MSRNTPSDAVERAVEAVKASPDPETLVDPSDLPRAAHDLARLLREGTPAEEACRALSIPPAQAAAWLRSPAFQSIFTAPEAIADHVRRTYAELVPQALATKAHLLRHADDAVRDRIASEIIKVASGDNLGTERTILNLSDVELNILQVIIQEITGE